MSTPQNKVFVGGLAWATTEDTLREVFSQAGNVTYVKVATDRDTGRSRGFGFVEFENDEEAQTAIDMFDGQEVDGRTVGVNVAKPRD